MDRLPDDLWRLLLEYGGVVEAERLRATCRFGRDLDLGGTNGVRAYAQRCEEAGVDPRLFSIPPRDLMRRVCAELCVGCGEGSSRRPLVLVVSCCGVKPLRFHEGCIRRFEGSRYVECPRCREPTNVVTEAERGEGRRLLQLPQ